MIASPAQIASTTSFPSLESRLVRSSEAIRGHLPCALARAATFGGIARLPGGTIMVRGRLLLGSGRSTLAVVGGTGRFSKARGTVSVTTVNASKGLGEKRLSTDASLSSRPSRISRGERRGRSVGRPTP